MMPSTCVCGFTPPDAYNPDCERCMLVRRVTELEAEVAYLKGNPICPEWQPLIKIAHCWLGGRKIEKDGLTEAFRSFLFSFKPMPNPPEE